jgi:hypothetical protein
MAGICSAHKHLEPGCELCKTHPRAIFPNWDAMVARAKAAGTQKCAKCKFEFYRTTDMCPKCGTKVKVLSLVTVSKVDLRLANELLWFVGEWAKVAGYGEPRVKQRKDGSFEVRVFDK